MPDASPLNTLNTDVLIVGAGPTGLALATTFAKSGINHMIVDKLTLGQNTSRAAVIHPHTLEVLESIGVSERLLQEGLKLATFSIRDRDSVLTRLQFNTLPSKYACLLMLPQHKTERILADPPSRSIILIVASVGKITFIALVLAYGMAYIRNNTGLVIVVDLLMILLFSGYLIGVSSRRV
jgi:hypothetical protein